MVRFKNMLTSIGSALLVSSLITHSTLTASPALHHNRADRGKFYKEKGSGTLLKKGAVKYSISGHGGAKPVFNFEYPLPIGDYLNTVSLVDSACGWAISNEGIIIKYNGTDWSLDTMFLETKYYLKAIFFLDRNHGWIVGMDGLILYYDGEKWARQESPVTKALFGVHFTDTVNGWIVGEKQY